MFLGRASFVYATEMDTASGSSKSDVSITSTAANLLEKMFDCAQHPDRYEEVPMQYSEEEEDDDIEEERSEKKSAPQTSKPTSYAQAAHASKSRMDYKTPLKNTLVCAVQTRLTMIDVLNSIEEKNLDKDLEGVQLIRGNTILEIVMKTEISKNKLLEEGLCIKGLHHMFQHATPNRTPSRRTNVSIIGLPLEAKKYQVGRTLEEMGFGRHVYTRPVIKRTPTKGTPYYSGILVAVMQDLVAPMPNYISVRGYRVRVIHTGQGASRPITDIEQRAPTPTTQTDDVTKTIAIEIAEKVIEEEITNIAEEEPKSLTKETVEIPPTDNKETPMNHETTKDDQTQETSEVEMTEDKIKQQKKRKTTLTKKKMKKRKGRSKKKTKRTRLELGKYFSVFLFYFFVNLYSNFQPC